MNMCPRPRSAPGAPPSPTGWSTISFMPLMFAPGYLAVYKEQRDRPPLSFLAGYQTPAPG